MANARTVDVQAGTGQTVDTATVDLITFAMPTDTVVGFAFCCLMRAAGGEGRTLTSAAVAKNTAGTVAQIGTTTLMLAAADAALAAATLTLVVSGTNLIFRGTGVAGQTLQWKLILNAYVN